MQALQLSKEMFVREIIVGQTAVKAFLLITFIILTALGAYVWIPLPFTPVPITLQTFFVLLSCAVLGGRGAAVSQFAYLLLGGLGIPIFAGATSGAQVFFGPTFGYLLGFIFAGWVVGNMFIQDRALRFEQILPAMLFGSLLIDLSGSLWLKVLLQVSWKKAWLLGLWPFIPGGTIKSILAALIYQRIQNRTRQILFSE